MKNLSGKHLRKSRTTIHPTAARIQGCPPPATALVGITDAAGTRALGVPSRPIARLTHDSVALARFVHSGSDDAVLMWNRCDVNPSRARLWIWRDDELTYIATIPSHPYCAVATDAGFCVMCPHGPVEIPAPADPSHADWTPLGDLCESMTECALPDISITTMSAGQVSYSTDAFTLTHVGFERDGATLAPSQVAMLSRIVNTAYEELCAKTAGMGSMIQPVLARWHLLDQNGCRLCTSAPVLLSPESGWQCCEFSGNQAHRISDDELLVDSVCVRAMSYVPRLSIRSLGGWSRRAAMVQVEVSPLIHPVDLDADCSWRLVRPSSADPLLDVAPGGTVLTLSTDHERRLDALEQLIGRCDALWHTLTTLTVGVIDGAVLLQPRVSDVRSECASVRAALSSAVAWQGGDGGSESDLMRSLRSQSGFVARCVATGANTVLWGDVTLLKASDAVGVSEWAYGRGGKGAWRGRTCLTLASGEDVWGSCGGDSGCPLSVRPLVCLNRGDVRRLRVWVRSEASAQSGFADVEMVPSADGSFSYVLQYLLEPLALAACGDDWTELPVDTATAASAAAGQRYQSAVVLASMTSPVSALCSIRCGHAPVMAAMQAMRSNSVWDFSRTHFYVFSAAGIFALTANASLTAMTVALIQPRGVEHGSSVTFTDTGVLAMCGDVLVRVVGSRTERVMQGFDAVALAWDGEDNRVWFADSAGGVGVLSDELRDIAQVGMSAPVSWLGSFGGRVLCGDGLSVMRLCRPPGLTDVGWRCELVAPCGAAARVLMADVKASCFEGRLSVSDADGSVLGALDIKGAVKAPLMLALACPCPWPRRLKVALSGRASADFELRGGELWWR